MTGTQGKEMHTKLNEGKSSVLQEGQAQAEWLVFSFHQVSLSANPPQTLQFTIMFFALYAQVYRAAP